MPEGYILKVNTSEEISASILFKKIFKIIFGILILRSIFATPKATMLLELLKWPVRLGVRTQDFHS